jgi:hypothetical protein
MIETEKYKEYERLNNIRRLKNNSYEIWNSDLSTIPWIWAETIWILISRWISNKCKLISSDIELIGRIITNPISLHFVKKFINWD